MNLRKLRARALAVILTIVIAQPLWLEGQGAAPVLPDPGSTSLDRQKQEQLGQQAMGEVYKQMPVLPDSSPVTRYVQELGKKLETVIPQDKSWPYQFHVVQASDINAFALPGGPIFVNVGTITAAENESELAGVMAHEMSHIYMQHSAKQAPKAAAAQIIAGLAGAVLGNSVAGGLARMGIQFGAGTVLMKYSRKDESQADAVGAIIMYKAGYNPKAMADFFTKLEQRYGNGGPQLLSSHPNPGNREVAIQKEVAQWPPKNFTSGTGQFAQIRSEAGGVKAYSAQEIDQGAKQGTWAQQNQRNHAVPTSLQQSPGSAQNTPAPGGAQGDISNVSFQQVKPSGNFTQFQQGPLSIAYPDNWKAQSDQQGGALIAPPAGVSQQGIAYGVTIGSGPSGSLDQATQQVLQSIQKDNPGAQVSGSPANINVNGVQGRSVYLHGQSPIQQNGQPLSERDWLVTVPNQQGGVMYLVFVAPENDFNKLHPTFQKMLNSLQLH